jgi:uncharacterized protein (DUF1800 family)
VATPPELVTHLYRRAGFGVGTAEAERLSHSSWTTLVDGLLAGLHDKDTTGDAVPVPHLTTLPEAATPGYTSNGYNEWLDLVTWWIERMVVTDTPLREKLTLLLHGQFPTSWNKVGWAYMMYVQNQIFRTKGPGNFTDLTQAIARDPAMLIWLDTDTSHKDAPNQNFARELMERFTMGAGNYTQQDVIEGARCFTGWELDQTTGEFFFNGYDHDYGVKTYLGHTGRLSGEDVIDIVCSKPACHTWVASRMWSFLAAPSTPKDRVVTELAAKFGKRLDMSDLLEAILLHPDFRGSAAVNGLIKQPIEYAVGAMRTLGLRTNALPSNSLPYYLSQLGQEPFVPPSVGGWGANQYWLTTGSANAYIGFAGNLASVADLSVVEDHNGNPSAQVAEVLSLVALPNVSRQTHAALMSLADQLSTSGGAYPAQQLVTMALVSPEFMIN